MRSVTLLLLLIPFISFSQQNKSVKKAAPAWDGFIITGNVTGYPDGTPVSFLNEETNLPEKVAVITGGKFVIKGKMSQPGFKGLIFNNEQPLIPLFLDNSKVKITGSKAQLDKLSITGSLSHDQFKKYTEAIKPYEMALLPDAAYDSASLASIALVSEDFVRKNPSSFVAPLAIIRYYQSSQNGSGTEELYKLLPGIVQITTLGDYIPKLIAESKINPIGSVVADFSQTDTSGNPIKISSFRGKYVLLDFWASWCRPCRQENPNVVAAYEKFRDKNFTILGISLDQNKKAWLDAIKMDGLIWGHVSDLKGWSNEVAAIFKVSSIPQNLLLDPEGRIIAKNLRGGALQGRLAALLK